MSLGNSQKLGGAEFHVCFKVNFHPNLAWRWAWWYSQWGPSLPPAQWDLGALPLPAALSTAHPLASWQEGEEAESSQMARVWGGAGHWQRDEPWRSQNRGLCVQLFRSPGGP